MWRDLIAEVKRVMLDYRYGRSEVYHQQLEAASCVNMCVAHLRHTNNTRLQSDISSHTMHM